MLVELCDGAFHTHTKKNAILSRILKLFEVFPSFVLGFPFRLKGRKRGGKKRKELQRRAPEGLFPYFFLHSSMEERREKGHKWEEMHFLTRCPGAAWPSPPHIPCTPQKGLPNTGLCSARQRLERCDRSPLASGCLFTDM